MAAVSSGVIRGDVPMMGPEKKWVAIALIVTSIALCAIIVILSSRAGLLPQSVQIIGSGHAVALASVGLLLILLHHREKRICAEQMQREIQDDQGWQMNDTLMNTVWGYALNGMDWDPTQPKQRVKEQVTAALKTSFVYSGVGIGTEIVPDSVASQCLLYLLKGTSAPDMSPDLLRHIFVKRDPDMSTEFSGLIQNIFNSLELPHAEEDARHFDAFVGQLLSLLPFAYPRVGATLTIPVKVDGQWSKQHYRIDRQMTLSDPLFSSSVPAYGLVAEGGPPLLLFLGTTYAEGSFVTFLADCTPGMSVGHVLYLYGREEIKEWLEDKQQVQLFGISLGGAMTFHVLRHHQEKIGRVCAVNAPGLYAWNWAGLSFDEGPEINLYNAAGDLVSTLGYFPTGKKVNHYVMIAGNKPESFLRAHALVYPAHDMVTYVKTDITHENRRSVRHLLTATHFTCGPFLMALPAMIFYLVVRLIVMIVMAPVHLMQKGIHLCSVERHLPLLT